MFPEKITFTENTSVLTVKEGENTTIWCEVTGEPQPNITWYFNGQFIPNVGEFNNNTFQLLKLSFYSEFKAGPGVGDVRIKRPIISDVVFYVVVFSYFYA